jgi:hypothetical protein
MNLLQPTDLLPGDVLLGHDPGIIGRAIYRAGGVPYPPEALSGTANLDEAGFAHAMIWITEAYAPTQLCLAECSLHGVAYNTLGGAVELNHLDSIIVRRPQLDWGRRAATSATNVVQTQRYRYACLQLLAMQRIMELRREDVGDPLHLSVVLAKLRGESAILRMLRPNEQRMPMVCSEFVFRVFSGLGFRSTGGLCTFVELPILPVPLLRKNPAAGLVYDPAFVSPGDLYLVDEPYLTTIGQLDLSSNPR